MPYLAHSGKIFCVVNKQRNCHEKERVNESLQLSCAHMKQHCEVQSKDKTTNQDT